MILWGGKSKQMLPREARQALDGPARGESEADCGLTKYMIQDLAIPCEGALGIEARRPRISLERSRAVMAAMRGLA